MRYIALTQSALSAMRANKIRTALTVLGMVIGIASVIIVFSAGVGINSLIVGQVESFGTDIIQTEMKVPTNKNVSNMSPEGGIEMVQGVQITSMTLDDMMDVRKLSNIKDNYPGIMSQEQVSYGSETKKGFIFGTNSSYINIDKTEIEFGRFFTEEENKSQAQVVVLGVKMKEKLFGDSDPLGKMIKIRKTKFRVIGITKERGTVMTMDFDDFVYVPVKTLQKRVMGIDHILYFLSEVHDMSIVDETVAEIRSIMRENHDITVSDPNNFSKDDFRVASMVEMMELMDTITGALTLLLLAIVAISLVVGGVGIMNIMYVVVTERTGEIGLRKAVGATRGDILLQFLIESVLITVAGGFFGVIFGVSISYLISVGASSSGLDWEFSVPLRAYITALGFSTFFGLAFGLYPARKAARMEPVEALRAE